MSGTAAIRTVDTASSPKKGQTTPDGLSLCPMEREQQYLELTPEDKKELHRLMTGKSGKGDGE